MQGGLRIITKNTLYTRYSKYRDSQLSTKRINIRLNSAATVERYCPECANQKINMRKRLKYSKDIMRTSIPRLISQFNV